MAAGVLLATAGVIGIAWASSRGQAKVRWETKRTLRAMQAASREAERQLMGGAPRPVRNVAAFGPTGPAIASVLGVALVAIAVAVPGASNPSPRHLAKGECTANISSSIADLVKVRCSSRHAMARAVTGPSRCSQTLDGNLGLCLRLVFRVGACTPAWIFHGEVQTIYTEWSRSCTRIPKHQPVRPNRVSARARFGVARVTRVERLRSGSARCQKNEYDLHGPGVRLCMRAL